MLVIFERGQHTAGFETLQKQRAFLGIRIQQATCAAAGIQPQGGDFTGRFAVGDAEF